MSKETKIGLTVIFVLLIVFSVVLAKRLFEPGEEAIASAEGVKAKVEAAGKDGPDKETSRQRSESAKPSKPTVVTPTTVSSTAGNRSTSNDLAQWSVVSDNSNEGASTNRNNQTSPRQLLMPDPQRESTAGRYGAPHSSQTSASASAGPQQYDPFQIRMAQTDGSQTTPAPPSPTPDTYGQDTYGSSYSSQYAQDNASRQQKSVYGAASESTYQSASVAPKAARSYDPYQDSGSDPYSAGGASRTDGAYAVKPNDNYWLISKNLYGTGAYFKALAEHNRDQYPDPDRLGVGDTIRAPEQSELEQAYPELCPDPSRRQLIRQRASMVSTRNRSSVGRAYTVESGDTLYDIARYELGNSSRWVEVYELNRDVLGDDFDLLTPGMRLVLPEAAADSVTRTPGPPAYQR